MSQNKFKFGMFGKKIGMTQIFDEDRNVVPVTVLEVGPNVVVQKKTVATDGYDAVQLGFEDKKKQRINKAEAGHFKKSNAPVKKLVREIRLDGSTIGAYEVGQVLTASLFQVGDTIDVTGTTIGRGYQGVIKRHNFSMVDATHNHEFFRHGGSIGCREWPGKVFKNKKMAGHMGNVRQTTQNLKVVAVEPEKNHILVKGAVPGPKNGYVMLRSAVKGGFAKRDLTTPKPPVEAGVDDPA